MSQVVSRLRQTLIEIDRQLLDALSSSALRTSEELEKIVKLEHARSATQRLLFAAEADDLKDHRQA